MKLTRRGWMGAAAAGLAAAPVLGAGTAGPGPGPAPRPDLPDRGFRVTAPGAGHDYTAALEALRAYARSELIAQGLPGMTLCVTDADGFTALLTLGWADVAGRVPVNSEHLFQIGSISKSFIALTVLSLADQGKIDLDAPLARYLSDAALPETPITIAQLLSHTTGLPDGAPLFPRTPDGRLWSGFSPGSRFSYSNTGFNLLGVLIERVTGLSHHAAVRRQVREKLGLEAMVGTISAANRARFAVGYWPAEQTAAANLPGAPMEPALWDEEDNPAGSLGANAAQMAIYLRALIAIASGKGAPVVSDASARRFATPVIATDEFGAGARYACGVAVQPVDGIDCLHHTGGMMSFSSSFHADAKAGVASFASVNGRIGPYRPRLTTAYAVRLMRAARTGAPLPAPPDPTPTLRIKDFAPLVGRYVSPGGVALTLATSGQNSSVEAFGVTGRLAAEGPGRLVTDHPSLAQYGLDAVREAGAVTALWWGETLFTRDGAGPAPTPSPALRPLAGVYLNRDPWVGGATVLVRGDKLAIDSVGEIVDRGAWWSAAKDPGGVERIRFDGALNGRMTRASASGADMIRLSV